MQLTSDRATSASHVLTFPLQPKFHEHSRGWEYEKFPKILWNPNVHVRVYKSPPIIVTRTEMNPLHILVILQFNFNIIFPSDAWISQNIFQLNLMCISNTLHLCSLLGQLISCLLAQQIFAEDHNHETLPYALFASLMSLKPFWFPVLAWNSVPKHFFCLFPVSGVTKIRNLRAHRHN